MRGRQQRTLVTASECETAKWVWVCLQVVRVLLQAGANPDYVERGAACLPCLWCGTSRVAALSAVHSHAAVLRLSMWRWWRAGLDDKTALHAACQAGHEVRVRK